MPMIATIDLETTGLDENRHEITEIAIIPADSDWNPREADSFKVQIRPQLPEYADPKALEIQGKTLAQLYEGGRLWSYEAKNDLLDWWHRMGCPRIEPLGHNFAAFDARFLKVFLEEDYDRVFHYRVRDTMALLSALRDFGFVDCKSGGLDALLEYCGIPRRGAHGAYEDALLTLQCYKHLGKELRSARIALNAPILQTAA